MPKKRAREGLEEELERASKSAKANFEYAKKNYEDAKKNYIQHKEKIFAEPFRRFEEELTFDAFYALCDFVRYPDIPLQVGDVLEKVGSKIPFAELKKIIEFITTDGNDQKWDVCEFSIDNIIESHYSSWKGMSDERLECLMPHMGDDFWDSVLETSSFRDVQELSLAQLREVFDVLSDPQ